MELDLIEKNITEHYDASAENYSEQYERKLMMDSKKPYPANYFRLQILLNSFISKNVKRVLEVGVGEGTPLTTLGKTGIDVWGFDISNEMVKKSKERMKMNGMDPTKIFWGDIQDPITYSHCLKEGQFDALMAMGVMPHVHNEVMTLKNMSSLIKPGGSVFIEFRNKLFSLFTFNRYTHDFIMNDLLKNIDPELKNIVSNDLKNRLEMDKPPFRSVHENSTNVAGYDAILSKFHNPFEMENLFKKSGFTDINLHWYHYHPAMPYLENETKEIYRNEALKLEHDPIDWRGYFLCSAFVVEAKKSNK